MQAAQSPDRAARIKRIKSRISSCRWWCGPRKLRDLRRLEESDAQKQPRRTAAEYISQLALVSESLDTTAGPRLDGQGWTSHRLLAVPGRSADRRRVLVDVGVTRRWAFPRRACGRASLTGQVPTGTRAALDAVVERVNHEAGDFGWVPAAGRYFLNARRFRHLSILPA